METACRREYAIVAWHVRDMNYHEMSQMHELKTRIKNVLDSHKSNSEKREYITDDDLKLMHAILSVFTREFSDTQTSEFDNFLKEDVDKPIDDVEFSND